MIPLAARVPSAATYRSRSAAGTPAPRGRPRRRLVAEASDDIHQRRRLEEHEPARHEVVGERPERLGPQRDRRAQLPGRAREDGHQYTPHMPSIEISSTRASSTSASCSTSSVCCGLVGWSSRVRSWRLLRSGLAHGRAKILLGVGSCAPGSACAVSGTRPGFSRRSRRRPRPPSRAVRRRRASRRGRWWPRPRRARARGRDRWPRLRGVAEAVQRGGGVEHRGPRRAGSTATATTPVPVRSAARPRTRPTTACLTIVYARGGRAARTRHRRDSDEPAARRVGAGEHQRHGDGCSPPHPHRVHLPGSCRSSLGVSQ